jgi:hypothetical protein
MQDSRRDSSKGVPGCGAKEARLNRVHARSGAPPHTKLMVNGGIGPT